MTFEFTEMIPKKLIITYIDDVTLQAKTKYDIWKNLQFFPNASDLHNCKLPETKSNSISKNSISWRKCFRQRIHLIGKKFRDLRK